MTDQFRARMAGAHMAGAHLGTRLKVHIFTQDIKATTLCVIFQLINLTRILLNMVALSTAYKKTSLHFTLITSLFDAIHIFASANFLVLVTSYGLFALSLFCTDGS